MAELVATARFARRGWLAAQVRLISELGHHADLPRRYDTYDSSGVARCREAMDCLQQAHGVQKFLLMGNCALANISLNAALADARVAGLILTNPYVPEHRTARLSLRIRRHLFNSQSWLRLLCGQMRSRRVLDAAEARLDEASADAALPADLPACLQRLAERDMRLLLAFSRSEPAGFYFRRHYGSALRRLSRSGRLRFEVLPSDSHDFSSHQAAAQLNGLISDWVRSSWSAETAPLQLEPALPAVVG